MKKKTSRGIIGYVILLGTLLIIAILLNGGLGQTVNKRIEYPELLQMIKDDQVGRVALRIRGPEIVHYHGSRFSGQKLRF